MFWFAAAVYAVVGLRTIAGALGVSSPEGEQLRHAYIAFGCLFLVVGGVAAVSSFLAKKSRAWLIAAAAALCLGLVIALFAAFWIDMAKGEMHRRDQEKEVRSGRYSFGDQPALLAVAQAVAANDQEAIRAAAKGVPDLQAAGRDGTTLLAWAVRETWQRPALVDAVRTLLSLGADPNHTNGRRESYALPYAVHGPAAGLAAMLEAGGDPNARDEFGRPIVLMIWYLGYYQEQQRARLELLLDGGADIDSTMPANDSSNPGYTLLLRRLSMAPRDKSAYADVLYLLERGADPQRPAADGLTFAKMLSEQREKLGFRRGGPPEFAAVWDWARTHGLVESAQ